MLHADQIQQVLCVMMWRAVDATVERAIHWLTFSVQPLVCRFIKLLSMAKSLYITKQNINTSESAI